MSKTLRRASAVWIVGAVAAVWAGGCSSSGTESPPVGSSSSKGSSSSSSSQSSTGSSSSGGGGGDSGGFTYTLIDDMETTTHGPIEYAGVMPPESPGYWFNFGAKYAGATATPPILMFAFSALPAPTTTLNGKVSTHAAHQFCSLNALTKQYDICGLGFEFAQVVDEDAGEGSEAGEETGDATDAAVSTVDAANHDAGDGASHDASNATDAAHHDASSAADASSTGDATVHDASDGAIADASSTSIEDSGSDSGDAAPPIPKVTIPFDISQYKGITFWGKSTGADAAGLDVKVQFPDTDTDPRGGVCNSPPTGASGPTDYEFCYNSFAEHLMFTGDWQQFTVMFSDLQQDPGYGYAVPSWKSSQVYGINWQAQDSDALGSPAITTDFWIDDVYFIQ